MMKSVFEWSCNEVIPGFCKPWLVPRAQTVKE